MTAPGFVTRAAWGARAPRKGIGSLRPDFGSTLHYEGVNLGAYDHGSCAGKVRGIQAFHMDQRGWLDIAYTCLVCRHGYIYEGRWAGKVTAANGTNDGNASAYAICGLFGPNDPVATPMVEGIAQAVAELRRLGAPGGLNGHRDWKPTACPDDDLYALIPGIDARADVILNPTQPAPPQEAPAAMPAIVLSTATPTGEGRLPAHELRPVDADTFVVVAHNGAKLARTPTGTTPSGLPFVAYEGTTGVALDIDEWNGKAVVVCAGSGTYIVSP